MPPLLVAATGGVLNDVAYVVLFVLIVGSLVMRVLYRDTKENARKKEAARLAQEGEKLRNDNVQPIHRSGAEEIVSMSRESDSIHSEREDSGCSEHEAPSVAELVELGQAHRRSESGRIYWKSQAVYGHTIEQFRAGSIAVICCKCIPAPIADGQSLEVAKSSAIVVVSCSFSGLASSVLSRLVASGSECLFIGWRTQEFWIGGERCSESSFSIRLAELG